MGVPCRGVRPQDRALVQSLVMSLALDMTQFRRVEEGIRSLTGSRAALVSKGLDEEEEEGYCYSKARVQPRATGIPPRPPNRDGEGTSRMNGKISVG